jgi:hypothetical protein
MYCFYNNNDWFATIPEIEIQNLPSEPMLFQWHWVGIGPILGGTQWISTLVHSISSTHIILCSNKFIEFNKINNVQKNKLNHKYKK